MYMCRYLYRHHFSVLCCYRYNVFGAVVSARYILSNPIPF